MRDLTHFRYFMTLLSVVFFNTRIDIWHYGHFVQGMDPYPVGMDPYPVGMVPYPVGTDPYPVGMDPYLVS